MKKYILLSGTDKTNGFYEEQAKYLSKELPNNSNITFIASSFDNYETNDLYYINMIRFFNKINIYFNKTYLIDNRLNKQEAQELILKSNIIYIMGGIPQSEMNSIKEYDLIDSIKNFDGTVIGVSAGSINMNKNICYVEENNEIVEYQGIGLVDYNIAPHLDFNNIDYLKEIFRVSKIRRTIALPNETFIVVEDNKETIYGDYYYFENETFEYNTYPYEEIAHIGTINLETDRLILRKTTKEDIEEFFYIQLNPKLRKYLGTTKIGNNPDKNRKYFDENKYKDLNYYRWTMESKDTHKILGTIYLNIHDEKAKIAGIDYWIREDEWGKGYTTEASKRILDFAFNELNLNRIESCGAKDNPGTWKIMEKIGLKYEGTRKSGLFYYYGGIQDLVMYGLTKEEYLTNKKQ